MIMYHPAQKAATKKDRKMSNTNQMINHSGFFMICRRGGRKKRDEFIISGKKYMIRHVEDNNNSNTLHKIRDRHLIYGEVCEL